MTIPIKERQRRISEGLKLAWKRRKKLPAQEPVRLTRKQLKKLALYLKYIAFILERNDAR